MILYKFISDKTSLLFKKGTGYFKSPPLLIQKNDERYRIKVACPLFEFSYLDKCNAAKGIIF